MLGCNQDATQGALPPGPPLIFSRGAAALVPPARADGRARDPYPDNLFNFWDLFWGSTGPGRYLIFFLVKFHVECTHNHVWGPPGARVMTIFIKAYIFVKVELGPTTVEKSFKNYIEWYSQTTKGLDFG